MLGEIGAFHPGDRGEGDPVAHVPNGPDAGHITLAVVVNLHAALVI